MDCKANNIDPEETARSCGFLKTAERRYLLGDHDYSRQYQSTLRNQIRTRTKHAFADFYLLSECLNEEQKRDVVAIDLNHVYDLKDEDTVEKMAHGPVRFVSEVLLGDDQTRDLIDSSAKADAVLEEENVKGKMKELIPTFVEGLYKSGYTKRQARMAIMRAWPE